MPKLVTTVAFLAVLAVPAFADETVVKEHHDDGPAVAVKDSGPRLLFKDRSQRGWRRRFQDCAQNQLRLIKSRTNDN